MWLCGGFVSTTEIFKPEAWCILLRAGLSRYDQAIGFSAELDQIRWIYGEGSTVPGDGNCPVGEFYNFTVAQCDLCGLGLDRNSLETTVCVPCKPGSYAPELGTAKCLSCDLFGDGNSYQNESSASACKTCPVGTQRVIGSRGMAVTDCECRRNFYRYDGLAGGQCSACPAEGECLGRMDLPFPKKNYWAASNHSGVKLRLAVYDAPGRDVPSLNLPIFFNCAPKRCAGGPEFACEEGYTGIMCNECKHGQFNWRGTCGTKCDDLFEYRIVTIVSIALVVGCWIGMNKLTAGSFDTLDVGLLYMQIMAIAFDFVTQYSDYGDTYLAVKEIFKIVNFDVRPKD